MPIAYHADAELDQVANSLTIGALLILAVAALVLVTRAPADDHGRRVSAKVALALALGGIAAHVALQFMQDESWDAGRQLQIAWAVFIARAVSFFLAAPLALAAFLRGQGRLAGVSLALSLVLPTLFVVWVTACGVTDACFH